MEAKLQLLFSRAMYLRNAGKREEALKVYDQALGLCPDNLKAFNDKGTCYKEMGDKEKAMQLYEYALKINVNDWQAHNNKGVIHKEAGELEKSVYHYRIAVKEGPQTDNIAKRNLAIALTDLGTRLQTQGKISASIELFIEAVTVDSTYEMAYFNLGVVYERSNPSKAIESYLRAVACKPNYAEALCNIGVIYKSKSDLPKAIAFYERALVANPNFEIAINNLAIAVTDFGTQVKYSGQLQSAISYYKKALTYNPHYSPAWYNLGVARMDQCQLDEAFLCYRMAISFDEKCCEAYNNLGVIYKDRGNLEKAIHYYSLGIKANPRFFQTLNNLGVIYTMLSDMDKAFSHCLRAIKCNPNYAEAYNNLGGLYRDEGRIIEALDAYNHAVTKNPDLLNAAHNRLLAMESLDPCMLQEERQRLSDRKEGVCEWTGSSEVAEDDIRLTYLHANEERCGAKVDSDPVNVEVKGRGKGDNKVMARNGDWERGAESGEKKGRKRRNKGGSTILEMRAATDRDNKENEGGANNCNNMENRNSVNDDDKSGCEEEAKGGRGEIECNKSKSNDKKCTSRNNTHNHKTNNNNNNNVENETSSSGGGRGSSECDVTMKAASLLHPRVIRLAEPSVVDQRTVADRLWEAHRSWGQAYMRRFANDFKTVQTALAGYQPSLGPAIPVQPRVAHAVNSTAVPVSIGVTPVPPPYIPAQVAMQMPVQVPMSMPLPMSMPMPMVVPTPVPVSMPMPMPLPVASAPPLSVLPAPMLSTMSSVTPPFIPPDVSSVASLSQISQISQIQNHTLGNHAISSTLNNPLVSTLAVNNAIHPHIQTHAHTHANALAFALKRPLRIGYLSADFCTHSVSYFIHAPLKHHTKNPHFTSHPVEVFCYSNVNKGKMDKKTQIFEEMGHEWRNIAGVSAIDAAQLIMMDGIDILVELSGHSDGNRLDVMALKPAPILVTWIGYPNTTGLPTIDYRISDAIADPVNSQQKYSERIVRLPSAFLCYTPLEEVPSVSVSPADINGYTTYGSFNNLVKVNERVMDVWCSVLLRQPTSRMVIKCKPFGSDMIKEKTYRRFQARGIARHRIDLLPLTPTTKEHLQLYSRIDIGLDTFPYSGTTTTCEALYMGVPVVTLQNITVPIHVHNVSSSLLSRIPSVRGLITTSMASYVQTASELGDPANIDHLRTLRASLRHEMEESSLCDGETFTAHLQALYYRIYEFHHTNTPLGSASEPCDASSANVGDTSASITAPASLIIPLPLVDSSQVPPVACDPSQSVGMHKWKTK